MKAPQIAPMAGMTALGLNRLAADQKTVAERQWSAPTRAKVAQKACDVGLFSDERDQLDMVEMFQQPAED